MRAALGREGLGAPAEILAWCGWQDGSERMGLVVLPPPGFMVIWIDEALGERRRLPAFALQMAAERREAGDAEEMEDAAYWWRASWLPIGKLGAGDCLIADLAAEERHLAPLRTWAAYEPVEAHERAAPSLTAAVSYWPAALEMGAAAGSPSTSIRTGRSSAPGYPARPPGLSTFLA